ncbi:MAG: V-type ATPase subunit [Oscillospiraceae bacterium]|jgi:V/A-type H+-transporting ATPase subunit C|nr:V-type ATPase subunit [Oscillospiraceae bacterium]
MISYVSNAVFVRVKAMYSRRLRENQLFRLSLSKNLNEVIEHLNKTDYSPVFSSLVGKEIHRETLELLLREKLFQDLDVLSHYDASLGEHFYKYVLTKFEIYNIGIFLVFLKANIAKDFVSKVPTFIEKNTKIDFKSLNSVITRSDFLKLIQRSDYLKILEPIINSEGELDLNKIGVALHRHLEEVLLRISKKYFDKKEKTIFLNSFRSYIDTSNFVKIFRLRKYFNSDDEYIRSLLLPDGNLTLRKLNELITSKDIDSLVECAKKIKWVAKLIKKGVERFDEIPSLIRLDWAKWCMKFSRSTEVMILAYIILKEAEIKKIIKIIENVRYGVFSSKPDVEKR